MRAGKAFAVQLDDLQLMHFQNSYDNRHNQILLDLSFNIARFQS